MKKIFERRLALMLTLFTVASVGPQLPVAFAAPATNFAPKGGGFAVWLPVKPQISKSKMPIPGRAPIDVKMYMAGSGPVSYVILPVDLPAQLNTAGVNNYLSGAQKGFLRSTGATLTSSKSITLNGYTGREIIAQLGTNVLKARFYAKNRRSYQFIAGSPKNATAAQRAQVAKVMSSFRITS